MGKRSEENGQVFFKKCINNVPQTTICAIMFQFMAYMPSQKLDCESTFESKSISHGPQGNLKK